MINHERLAKIEASMTADNYVFVGHDIVRWLIAEVRRLTKECEIWSGAAHAYRGVIEDVEQKARDVGGVVPDDYRATFGEEALIVPEALGEAREKIKELTVMLENANTAIETWRGEYARGRADAVESIVKLIQATGGRLDRLAFFLEATDG